MTFKNIHFKKHSENHLRIINIKKGCLCKFYFAENNSTEVIKLNKTWDSNNQAKIYLFKINKRNATRKRCEMRSKSMLTLNIFHTFFWCFYC